MTEIAECEKSLANRRAMLADLSARRDALAQKVSQIEKSKADLSLDALSDAKSPARKQLDALNTELIKLRTDFDDHNTACQQAQAKVSEAQAALAAAKERERLNGMLAMLPGARAEAQELTAAIDNLPAAAKLFVDATMALRTAGAPLVGHNLVRVNLGRAIQVGLIPLSMNTETIPPNQRHTASELADRWLGDCERGIKAKLAALDGSAALPPPAGDDDEEAA